MNWPPPAPPSLCAALPSMHSAWAQSESPRCQAPLVAYRTPDAWSSVGHALRVASFQLSGSRGSAASPHYLHSPFRNPSDLTEAKKPWINSPSFSSNIFMEDRSLSFFLSHVWYFVFVGNQKECTNLENTTHSQTTIWQCVCACACVCLCVCVSQAVINKIWPRASRT